MFFSTIPETLIKLLLLCIVAPAILAWGCAEHAADIGSASDQELFNELTVFSPLLPAGRHDEIRGEMLRRHPDWNWTAIDKKMVVVGMRKEEVTLSYGPPDRINQSSYGEQWVYQRSAPSIKPQYLHFEGDILTDAN